MTYKVYLFVCIFFFFYLEGEGEGEGEGGFSGEGMRLRGPFWGDRGRGMGGTWHERMCVTGEIGYKKIFVSRGKGFLLWWGTREFLFLFFLFFTEWGLWDWGGGEEVFFIRGYGVE